MAWMLPYASDPNVVSARGLVTAALVLYGVVALIFFLIGVFVFLALIGAAVSLIMFLVVYIAIQEPLKRGDVVGTATPTLVLGIISILIVNIISGILLLVAYAKINRAEVAIQSGMWGDAPAGGLSPPGPLAPPGSGASGSAVRYCSSCRAPLVPSDHYCTNCGTTVAT